MTDERDTSDGLDVRLRSLAARTDDLRPRRAWSERLASIPDGQPEGFVASVTRLAMPSLALAGALAAALVVADANAEPSFDDDLASAVTMELGP